jgi:peroxiredoxin
VWIIYPSKKGPVKRAASPSTREHLFLILPRRRMTPALPAAERRARLAPVASCCCLRPLLLLLGGWLLPEFASAQHPFPYAISGHFGALPASAIVYLRDKARLIDSAQVRAGRFTLRGIAQQPHSVLLLAAPEGKLDRRYRYANYPVEDALRVFVEPSPVVLTSPNTLVNARVSQGPVNLAFQRYKAQLQALAQALYASAHPERESRTLGLPELQRHNRRFDQLTRTYIQQHPDSWVSLDLLRQRRLGPAQYDAVAPLYAQLSPPVRTSPLGRAYGQLLDSLRTVALGAVAPDLTLTTPAGKPVRVQDYRGQYLLLQFWSSQCECRLALEPTAEVCRRFPNLSLAVLTVSLEEPGHRKQWLRELSDYHLPGTTASNLDGLAGPNAHRYRIEQLPQNFLLDPAGRILAVNVYGEELAAALATIKPVPVQPRGK